MIITLSIGRFANLDTMRAFVFLTALLLGLAQQVPLAQAQAQAQPAAPQTVVGSGPLVGTADLLYGQVFRLMSAKPGQPGPKPSRQPLQKGAQLFQGDTLETGENGHVYIATVDQAFISIRPNSRLTIESYQASPGNANNTAIRFTLHQGVARFVSGQAVSAAKNRFRLNTPVAAIGVRGTDFTVFTTSTVTRASVLSGRIAVSPFNESCQASGLGPCRGASSLDLAAGDVPVIELTRGDQLPKLLQSEELAPDRLVPPRPDERPSQRSSGRSSERSTERASGSGAAATASSGISVGSAGAAAEASPVNSALAEVKADDRLLNPQSLPPAVLNWGRWKALADMPAGELNDSGLVDTQVAAILGSYLLRVSSTAVLPLPQTGKVGFVLRDHEVFLVQPNGKATALGVQSPELFIDFPSQRFSTRLDLTGAQDGVLSFRSSGGITATGLLMNDQAEQPATLLRGVVAGPGGSQAGYLFEQRLGPEQGRVSGATRWAR